VSQKKSGVNAMTGTVRSNANSPSKSRTLHLSTRVEHRPDPERGSNDEYRRDWIALNAYYRAERRGFLRGYEVEDWFAAERELEQLEQAKAATHS
jgi:hypothetical protein